MIREALPEVDSFLAAVDTTFLVHLDEAASIELPLVEVATYDRAEGWESFSLIFHGPRPAFAQAVYVVEHASMGSFELFLVPIHSPAGEQRYEAVFNRPHRVPATPD